jgi:hypothetical protein
MNKQTIENFDNSLNQLRLECDDIEEYNQILLDNGLIDLDDYQI